MAFPKGQPTVEKVVDPTPHREGQTTPAADGDTGTASPRLPHERDESADGQSSEPQQVIQQAHDDLERGLVDTDRGPVLDDLYENRIRTETTPARGEPPVKNSIKP